MVPRNMSQDQKLARKQVHSEIVDKNEYTNFWRLQSPATKLDLWPGNKASIHAMEHSCIFNLKAALMSKSKIEIMLLFVWHHKIIQ